MICYKLFVFVLLSTCICAIPIEDNSEGRVARSPHLNHKKHHLLGGLFGGGGEHYNGGHENYGGQSGSFAGSSAISGGHGNGQSQSQSASFGFGPFTASLSQSQSQAGSRHSDFNYDY